MSYRQKKLDQCLVDIETQGWCMTNQLIPLELCNDLLMDLQQLRSQEVLKKSSIGRAQTLQEDSSIRGDFIFWFDNSSTAQTQLLQQLDSICQTINRQLFLNLQESEIHYAYYPPQNRYHKHHDTFKNSSTRTLTFILYLNQNWKPEDGGQLLLYNPKNENEILKEITPEFGSCVMFLSADFPHEVKKTNRERFSVTGWLKKPTGSLF